MKKFRLSHVSLARLHLRAPNGAEHMTDLRPFLNYPPEDELIGVEQLARAVFNMQVRLNVQNYNVLETTVGELLSELYGSAATRPIIHYNNQDAAERAAADAEAIARHEATILHLQSKLRAARDSLRSAVSDAQHAHRVLSTTLDELNLIVQPEAPPDA